MVDKILIIGLIIFCLLVNYITWQLSNSICTSIPSILAFNSVILLIYKIKGAEWVYWIIWKVVGYMLYFLSFIWTYPYHSAVVIIVLLIWSLVWQYLNGYERAQRRERETLMLEDIDRRLRRMEEQQEEILRLLRATHTETNKNG